MTSALGECLQYFLTASGYAVFFLEKKSSTELRDSLREQEESEFHLLLKRLIIGVLFDREDDPERQENLFAIMAAKVNRDSEIQAAQLLEREYLCDLDPRAQNIIKERFWSYHE